jgi:hypothetical protein
MLLEGYEQSPSQNTNSTKNFYENSVKYTAIMAEMNAVRGQGGCNPPPCFSRCPASRLGNSLQGVLLPITQLA